jgi:cytochrome c oxidase subunit II
MILTTPILIAAKLLPALLAAAPSEIVPRARGLWMPEQASTVAPSVDFVFNLITWISIFFFVLITVLLVIFVVRYRRVEGRERLESPTHHMPLELTWTIIPLMLVIVIFYMGMQGYLHLRSAPVDSYEVYVTAQRWWWEFEHRDSGCRETHVLRVPVNRPVRLIMTSEDVLHSLFIPAFRVKQDVVPGRYATLWFEATKTGEFDLFCAEYCGKDHSVMVARVIVYEEEDFQAAVEQCAAWIDPVPEELLHYAGAELYGRCISCHSLEPNVRVIGPSLMDTHNLWGQERRFADGRTRVVDENYILDSIRVPGRDVVEGYPNSMPAMPQLREREARALVEFIRRLDEIELDDRGRPIIPEYR